MPAPDQTTTADETLDELSPEGAPAEELAEIEEPEAEPEPEPTINIAQPTVAASPFQTMLSEIGDDAQKVVADLTETAKDIGAATATGVEIVAQTIRQEVVEVSERTMAEMKAGAARLAHWAGVDARRKEEDEKTAAQQATQQTAE